MTRDEFAVWIGNPHMMTLRAHPRLWRGDKDEIKKWEANPYEHPYTRGAYEMLRTLGELT